MHTRILNAKNQQTYVLFYEDESVFSNFHPSNFEAETAKKLVNSGMFKEEEMLKFNCSEQYFMWVWIGKFAKINFFFWNFFFRNFFFQKLNSKPHFPLLLSKNNKQKISTPAGTRTLDPLPRTIPLPTWATFTHFWNFSKS